MRKLKALLTILSVLVIIVGCTEPTETETIVKVYEDSKEELEEHKVVFNANGGSGTMETISIKAETSIVLPTNTFKRTNYYFIGWSTTEDGEVMFKNADIFQGLYSDITLYAVWQQNPIPEKSTITFNANGGNGVMEKLTTTVDSPMKLSANTFTREGYTFAGWAEEKDGTKKYDNQAEITLENDDGIILYAVWEPITYKIQFSSNLDENLNVVVPETITIDYDKAFKLPVLEDIDGQYYFKGWNTSADGKGENYSCNNEIKNLTSKNNTVLLLYGRWSAEGEHIINYVLDGGTNDSNNQSLFHEEDYVYLYTPSHSNPNYSFAGWYDNNLFLGDSITEWYAYEKLSDVTLYAKWNKPTYKVTLVSKVDNENTVSVSVNATFESNMPKIVIPYRDSNYSFGGYFTMENGLGKQYYTANGESTSVYDKEEDLTLYAYWIKNTFQYEVTFVANDDESSNVGVKITVTYDENMPDIEPSSSRNENYIFAGYFTGKNCQGEQYYTADGKALKKYELKSDLTLYAGWIEVYSITYVLNGGTNDENNPDSYTALTETITLAEATKTGYVFGGWYTDEDCTKSITEIVKGSIGAITLYAKWIEVYSITYVLNGGTNDENNPIGYTALTETITLGEATKTGYVFGGWYTDEACTKGISEIVKGSIGDITLYAKWMITADSVATAIELLSGEGPHNIAVTGAITNETISAISTALQNNSSAMVNLDLNETTGLTEILDDTFYGCNNLTNIIIPDSVKTLGFRAFCDCYNLTNVTIPDSVTTIGDSAFNNCSNLTNVTIPECVTTIGGSAFGSCYSLASIIIPDSVTTIGDNAFYDCSSLTSMTIPDSVTTIGYIAFYGCENLASVTFEDANNWYYTSNSNYIGGTAVDVTDTAQNATYLTSTYNEKYWYKHVEITVTGDNVAKEISKLPVGNYAVVVTGAITNETISAIKTALQNNSSAMVNLDLSETTGLTEIPYEAFYNCENLASMTIPDSVTTIGYYAFYFCDNLASVTFADTNDWYYTNNSNYTDGTAIDVTDTAQNATYLKDTHYSCYWYKHVEITVTADNVAKEISKHPLGSYTVAVTGAITNDTVSAIKTALQNNSSAMVSLDLSGTTGLTEIPDEAFYDYDNLTNVIIPDGVTSIGDRAFSSCSSLTSVTIPDSVTSIGSYAFYDCYRLASITFEDANNWYYTSDSNYTDGTAIDVTDSTQNATYLKDTYYYYYYYWYKE